ncbi:MAG TPA: L,D-transpeptidase family protein [Bryobacteraceae bacterium]|nr:L,D-transpeptidase family protein [Bryobacteraceae bacterium]
MFGVLVFLLVLTASFPPASAEPPPADCGSALCRLLVSDSLPSLRWPHFSDYKVQIQNSYQNAGYTYFWIRAGRATEQAKTVIQALQESETKGLNPEDYDGPRWNDRLLRLRDAVSPPPETDLAEFDLALTVSAMRYISDLRFGRANPRLFQDASDVESEKFDLPSFLRELVHATDAKAALDGIEPPYQSYRRTERALQQYIAMARQEGVGLLPVTKKPVEPGASYAATAPLAERLRLLGDLPKNVSLPLDLNIYNGPLVDAVRRFQVRHGLQPDARIGKATLAQLNTPLSHRVQQLQLTLERWRWMPHGFPQPPIVINIPEFELRATNDSYQTELQMKVVVGAAYRHQTPAFLAYLQEVVFRPYWNVPLSIQRAELVPKLERDAAYLVKNRYEVVTPQYTFVSNRIVDQATLAQLRSGTLRTRQIPGPENALGLVAFRFPNEYDVYLHGTPAAQLFEKTRRDFSHGCIRAEKPQQLAEWVMRNQPQWTPERIAEAMNGEKTIHVRLERPIPVLIVYATAIVLESGEVRFFEDIYGQDATLAKTLESRGKPTSAGRGQRLRE